MKQLSKYLKPEEIRDLQEKGPEFLEKFEKQLSNPLYKDANHLYNRVQIKQLEKAAEKYPNPLNTDDWSNAKMINHALEEMVDLSHYITMIKKRMIEMEIEINDYKKMADYWRNKYRQMKFTYEMNVDPEAKTEIKKP